MTTAPEPPLPVIGQEAWGEQLNTYLEWVSGYAASNDARIAVLEDTITEAIQDISSLQSRVTALENKPNYVFQSAPWQFSSSLPPATGNQVRLNSPTPSLATQIDFRNLDSDSADRSAWLAALDTGGMVRIQDWNNAASYYRYDVTGPAIVGATNTQVPVTWKSGAGTVPNAKCNVGLAAIWD